MISGMLILCFIALHPDKVTESTLTVSDPCTVTKDGSQTIIRCPDGSVDIINDNEPTSEIGDANMIVESETVEDIPVCPSGGTEIKSGYDMNDDMTISDMELVHILVICDDSEITVSCNVVNGKAICTETKQ